MEVDIDTAAERALMDDLLSRSASGRCPFTANRCRTWLDEIDRLRSQNNRMRHLLAGDVSWLMGSVSFSPASAAARDKAERVSEAIRNLFAGDGE